MKYLDAHAMIDAGLYSGQSLWRPQPFHTPRVPWRHSHPDLYRELLHLSEAELDLLQRDRAELHQLVATYVPSFGELARVSQHLEDHAAFTPATVTAGGSRDHLGIPGKKWQQVEAFAAAVPKRRVPAVDWCSGKGFLSHRLLAHDAAASVTCLEIDPALVAAGQRRAAESALPLKFAQSDVLGESPVPPEVGPDALHVALHACGGLHRHMLRGAVAAGAAQIAVAPCCYHKHPPGGDSTSLVRSLSTAASRSQLVISHAEMRLAGSAARVARRRDRRLRDREMTWRLAFAVWHRREWHRRARGGRVSTESDTSIDWSTASRLPSVPLPVLAQGSSAQATIDGFESFCRWGATVDSASAPARAGLLSALDSWTEREASFCLKLGAAQAARLARQELVRHAYQRPLEQWLVLDACLYLEECGYDVVLRRFCDASVSPRNLLIVGERGS